jgi:hypothetical protein
VLAILADAAHADGIVWWSQELIAEYANCSEREVRRATASSSGSSTSSRAWAQQGRSRIKVYRLLPGKFGELDVDYNAAAVRDRPAFLTTGQLSARRALAANPSRGSCRRRRDTRTNCPVVRGADDRTSRPRHPDISSATPGHLVRAALGHRTVTRA